jgi:hypothetical protein
MRPLDISNEGKLSSLIHTLLQNYDLIAVFAINASIALPQSLLNW